MMAHSHQHPNDHDETTVLTTTEARQGRNYGVWKILALSLTLAIAAGAAFMAAGFRV
jgi:hypothetical protein